MESTEMAALTTYEVADNGYGVRLHFKDADGGKRTVLLPFECLQQLTLAAPKIVLEALKARYRDSTLRLVHNVESWAVERASDRERSLLTFTTPDQFTITFNVSDEDLAQMSDSLSVYDLDAFPQGLHFHH